MKLVTPKCKNLNNNIMKKVFVIVSVVMFAFLGGTQQSFAQKAKKTDVVKIKTSAVCGMCKERIEKNIAFEKGVTDVVLDNDTKIVTVTYKTAKTSPEKIKQALSKLGYDADDVPADKAAYDKLPPCCKKDATPH